MPLTDLISFEGVLMSGFSRKGEQMLKSFKQAYKCCCFHFYRHSRETETVCPSKRILLTHLSLGGMFESYHVAGDHTFPCGLSCMDALGVSCLLFLPLKSQKSFHLIFFLNFNSVKKLIV